MAEKTVIALGFFDGVHIGHGALLRKTVERAKELDIAAQGAAENRVAPAAFTFDRAPKEFVTGVNVPLLTSVDERRALIRDLYGIERTIVAPFDRAMMTMPWQSFLERLVARYGAAHLVAGHDYRFGYQNEGTPELLRDWCAAHGLGCDVISKVELGGVTVSSTHIRALVEDGDVERAAEFLGHPYAMTGEVAHGHRLGSTELFPTVNLMPEAWRVLPRRGVYAARATLWGGGVLAAVTNVGVRPTVGGGDDTVSVETHLIDWDGDIYGQPFKVEFLRFLRDERPFGSVPELHAQIEADIAAARRFIRKSVKK
ncbi:MAG: riboflavin biosynthesis protein RibF [Oscillospiraceae bacterium]|nr:riboflavin biosynthesis protein RibF [Oscillospiraceae bacterium]